MTGLEVACAWCPTCDALVSTEAPAARADGRAQAHAKVTGHLVHVRDPATWRLRYSVAGEPGLPF